MKPQEAIRQDVTQELEWEPALDAAGIGVAVQNGAVTLTGHVRSYFEKRMAEKAARRVAGVFSVANDLTVRTPGSVLRDDTDIAQALASPIKWTESIPKTVRASVTNGMGTLEGEVDWEFQRRAAERATRERWRHRRSVFSFGLCSQREARTPAHDDRVTWSDAD